MSVFQEGLLDGQIAYALQKTSWLKFKNDVINEIFSRFDADLTEQSLVIIRSLMVEQDKFVYWCRMIHKLQTCVRNIIPSVHVTEYGADGLVRYERRTDALVCINEIRLSERFYRIIVHIHHQRIIVIVS